MYTGLLRTHRTVAYLFLVATTALILFAIYRRISGAHAADSKQALLAKIALISGHTQLLLGLGLYFVGPWFDQLTSNTAEVMKTAELRWFAVEHIGANLVGIVLLTIGNSKFKKATDAEGKDKALLIYFGLGLLLIASRIPWDRLF